MFPVTTAGGYVEGSERLTARLRKPPGFKGHPIFADDRRIDPYKYVKSCIYTLHTYMYSGYLY